MRSRFVARARFLSFLFVAIAALLSLRLYIVQVIHGDEHRKSAEGQYVQNVEDREERKDIFFTERDGDLIAAAVTRSGYRVAIDPREIEDAQSVFDALSSALPLDKERFLESAGKRDDPYEEIAFRLTSEESSRVRAQKIPGVIIVGDQWRYYPAGPLAAHAIGFVGYKGDRKVGVYGLESEWQDTLSKFSSGQYVNPFAEIFANFGAALSSDPASQAGSIVTSIEPQVESRLEDVLDDVMQKYTPRSLGGIVMDAKTGEIIAIGARPGFDPNTFNTVEDSSVFSNMLVENVYEMGSIMKPLTMAAGLDAGAITTRTTYEDRGCIERSGKTICNYDGKARGVVLMQEILNQSLNLGVTFVAEKMGQNVFREYIHAFGLGEKTGIDLPNEATGIITSIERGYDVDFASASFGQGLAVTGVEMIRALGVLANGGVLPSPHLVTGVKLESGIIREIAPPPGSRVLKEETVDTVSDMLVTVFDKALLGGVLKQEHYSIAAKTGTAQIARRDGGGYYDDRFLHSFFGYFPAHEPRYIVFLMALEPHGAEFASATLARPFLDIAKFLINYYDIPPDR